ncbi:MAG: FAD-dependent oxidoreductase [Acidimicrobiales bacterium]|jgi:NADPH-dependent 2,4-dienoyl-CoA reductase/sulfur reductase-like enzyme|nr:FAD-dependent oxidoreductase [Acidimicrobiales bacterium]
MDDSIAVVGASLAGLHAARTLRHEGFGGRLTVVDADPHTPYDRPPLSKQVLTGDWGIDRIVLPAATEDLDLEWQLGCRAVALDAATRRLSLDGPGATTTEEFGQVVVATGAAARRLPGTEGIAGIHVLRDLDDAVAVREALDGGAARVVVIGAGFIGAEVAASCRHRDLAVTVVEALPVPLERALGAEMGAVCARLHEHHGVDLRLGTGVQGFETDTAPDGAERVRAVVLADGSTVDADLVVVGIGVAVNTGWLEGSGLRLDDGVVTDETLLAAPGVVAAGDVARYPSARFGQPLRVEHWEHAISGGEAAAHRLLAERAGTAPAVFDPVPWFWSDQYDRKIQLAGRPGPGDEVAVVHGSTDEFRFVALYRRGDRLVGVLGMNRPRHVMQLRALLEEDADWDAALERAAAL